MAVLLTEALAPVAYSVSLWPSRDLEQNTNHSDRLDLDRRLVAVVAEPGREEDSSHWLDPSWLVGYGMRDRIVTTSEVSGGADVSRSQLGMTADVRELDCRYQRRNSMDDQYIAPIAFGGV